VSGTGRDDGEDKRVEVPLERLGHRPTLYT
jgi:hypothetical protein